MNVDAFAEAALPRVAANEEIIILPRMWRFLERLDRLFPKTVSTLAARAFFKEYERLAQKSANSD
jgi:hypothetical protein